MKKLIIIIAVLITGQVFAQYRESEVLNIGARVLTNKERIPHDTVVDNDSISLYAGRSKNTAMIDWKSEKEKIFIYANIIWGKKHLLKGELIRIYFSGLYNNENFSFLFSLDNKGNGGYYKIVGTEQTIDNEEMVDNNGYLMINGIKCEYMKAKEVDFFDKSIVYALKRICRKN